MKTSILALAAALAASTAFAVTTGPVALSPTVYADLGAGPLLLSALGGNVIYQTADTKPADATPGFLAQPGDAPICLTGHVWAIGSTSSARALVSVGGCAGASGGSGGGGSSGSSFQLAPALTVQAAAYSAGNALGGLVTLTGAARTAGGTGSLMALRLASAAGAAQTIWIYAWSKTPASTCADKAAFVKSAADNAYSLPGFPQSVTLASPGAFDTGSYGALGNLAVQFDNQDTTPGTAIYLCLVAAAGFTPAATSDFSIVATGVQD